MTFATFVRRHVSPVQYLVLTNITQTAAGLLKGLLIARLLGPELLGVTAVLGGLNRVVANLIDIRLTDLASKLYYEHDTVWTEDQVNAYRVSLLITSILFNAALAVGMMVVSILLTVVTVHLFTPHPVLLWWVVAYALAQALATITSTIVFLQRFVGYYYRFGTARIAAGVIEIVLFIGLMFGIGGLDGYFAAVVTASGFMLLAMLVVTVHTWTRRIHLSVAGFQPRPILHKFAQHRRILFYGNLLGYTNLLHRAADVLVVGYFASDYVTGIYKFARTLTDSLYILYDALNQVYQPICLQLLAARQLDRFRNLARRFTIYGLAGMAVLLTGELIFLRPLLELIFGTEYISTVPPMLLLTLVFGFVTTVYLWAYPVLLHSGILGRYTLIAALGCAGQYATMLLLFNLFPPEPVFAAAGYCVYYVILLPAMIVMAVPLVRPSRLQDVRPGDE